MTKRITWLDALRGFALFGILLANIPLLAGLPFSAPLPSANGLDSALGVLEKILIEGKFYALFSFLFGFGFALQIQRSSRANASTFQMHSRRMWILLGIGLIHACLIWWGDILWVYALLGFALIFIRTTKPSVLLTLALFFLSLPILVYLVFWMTAMPDPLASNPNGEGINPLRHFITAASSGTYLDLIQSNWMMMVGGAIRRLLRFQILRIFGMFLLGVWAARIQLQNLDPSNVQRLRRWLLLALGVGLPTSMLFAWFGGGDALLPATTNGLLAVITASFAIPTMALGYVALFALLRNGTWQKILAATGRMSLTNYISHSVIGLLLFYHFGFGGWGQFRLSELYLIATMIFLLQMLWSYHWLKHFKQGPLEALWRRL